MRSQQRNLRPLHEVFTSAWSRIIPRITTRNTGRMSCHAVPRQIALYLANTKCTPASNAKLKDRNCRKILLTKGITVTKWTAECNALLRNKGKEVKKKGKKKETTSNEGREFPVHSDVNFRLWWHQVEVSECRYARNNTFFVCLEGEGFCFAFFVVFFFLEQDFMLGLFCNFIFPRAI